VLKNLCVIFLAIIVSISPAQESKMNIAVIDLDPTGISNNEAQFLSDRLRTELFETGKFQVVEREKMNTILEEQGFQQTGCTTVECAIEIGQLLNVTVMVAGSIGKIEEIYSLSIRMIDVQTGALMRTATRDYEGKLSEVLTDVIPEISEELAEAERLQSEKAREDVPLKSEEDSEFNRWGILLKLGFSFLNYTGDINDEIDKVDPLVRDWFGQLSNHSNVGLELRYVLSEQWKLKIGFASENMLSPWQVTFNDLVISERTFQFLNTYLGINYSLWQKRNVYDIYIGTDVGSSLLNSEVTARQRENDGTIVETDASYEYSRFTWKLSLGGIYFLSSRFSLGFELALKGGGKFNISDQFEDTSINDDGSLDQAEIDSNGLQTVVFIGYHF
jgi:hypothetical protein